MILTIRVLAAAASPALAPVDRELRAAGEGRGVERVHEGLSVIAKHAQVDDQGRERKQAHEDDREQDQHLAGLSAVPPVRANEPHRGYSRTIWTVELSGMVAPKNSGKNER